MKSQPVLLTDIVEENELKEIVRYSIGRSKVFLVVGDEYLFHKCLEVKWKIRDKYSPSPEKYIKGKIRPFFIHCSDNKIDTERDVASFIPEKLEFVRLVNSRQIKENLLITK